MLGLLTVGVSVNATGLVEVEKEKEEVAKRGDCMLAELILRGGRDPKRDATVGLLDGSPCLE